VLFSLLLLVFCAHAYAQNANKIPRKLRGVYTGIQPSYTYRNDGKEIHFSQITIEIKVEKYSVSLCFADQNYCPIEKSLAYSLKRGLKPDNKSYWMLVPQSGSFLKEEWNFNLLKKELVRKGIAPQPDTHLTRSRKVK